MKNKTVFVILSAIFSIFAMVFLFSCASEVSDSDVKNGKTENSEYGFLDVAQNEKANNANNRALLVEGDECITKADIFVIGYGMQTRNAENVDVTNGRFQGARVENIKVGKNRVVKIVGKNTINNVTQKMAGSEIFAVTDIVAGENSVNVNWGTTALGKVFDKLIASNYDVSPLSPQNVLSFIPENTHSSLIDTDEIASDVKNGTVKNPDLYKIEPASVEVKSDIEAENITLQVSDPSSRKCDHLLKNQTINNVTPGNWKVYAIENVNGVFSILSNDAISLQAGEAKTVSITLKVPRVRLEDENGNEIDSSENSNEMKINSGSQKTFYLVARTVDGEVQRSDVEIYYTMTNDGSCPRVPSKNSGTLYDSSAGIKASVNSQGLGTKIKAIAVQVSSGSDRKLKDSDVVSFSWEKTPICASPEISGDDHFSSNSEISITSETEGAVIFYTKNGKEPTENSDIYENAFTIDAATTISAFAVKDGFLPSKIVSKTFSKGNKTYLSANFTLEEVCVSTVATQNNITNTPAIGGEIFLKLKETAQNFAQPLRNSFRKAIDVVSGYLCDAVFNLTPSFNCDASHKTGYAFDLRPTSNTNEKMTEFVAVVKNYIETNNFEKVIFKRMANGLPDFIHIEWKGENGEQQKQIFYEVQENREWVLKTQFAKPVIQGENYFTSTSQISITSATEGAVIYYTTDGTPPTTSSTLYSSPFSINSTTTIKAIATSGGSFSSDVQEKLFYPNIQLSANFKLKEVCASSNITAIAQEYNVDNTPPISVKDKLQETVVNVAQPIRSAYGNAINAISGYICDDLNSKPDVNECDASHTTGYALDLRPTNGNMANFMQIVQNYILSNNFDKIIFKRFVNGTPQYVHISYKGENGEQRKQIFYEVQENDSWVLKEKCALPIISGSEQFSTSTAISISSQTENAEIYYTLDGSLPTQNSTRYTNSFSLTSTTTVNAVSIKEGNITSEVATKTFSKVGTIYLSENFTLQEVCASTVATANNINNEPATSSATFFRLEETALNMAQPIRNVFGKGINVVSGYLCDAVFNLTPSFNCDASHKTGYAFDLRPSGNTPEKMTAFVKAVNDFVLKNNFEKVIFKRMASENGLPDFVHIEWKGENGEQQKQIFYEVQENGQWVQKEKCLPPVISGVDHFTTNSQISITSHTSGTVIYYTLDHKITPTTSSTLYSSPFTISAVTTVKAIATKPGALPSEVATKVFSKGDKTYMTQNFTLEETCASSTATSRGIDNTPFGEIRDRLQETAENLAQPLRDFYGKGIKVSSGYRCPALNSAIGGSSTSAHMSGYALDLQPSNGNMQEFMTSVQTFLSTHDFDQVIYEQISGSSKLPRWIHIGWKNPNGGQRKQILYQVKNSSGSWVYSTVSPF